MVVNKMSATNFHLRSTLKPYVIKKRRTMNVLKLWLLCSIFIAVPHTYGESKEEINAAITSALTNFEKEYPSVKPMFNKAKGYLIFPTVYKAGFGIGGSYGEGALVVNGNTVQYYSIAGASIGLQFGAQTQAQMILFMTDDALSSFRSTSGWKAGVDGSVAIAAIGAGGAVDSETLNQPRIGFIFGNKGLMYNATLEGAKMTKIDR